MGKRKCIFCHQDIVRQSVEHVFPQWLLDRFGLFRQEWKGWHNTVASTPPAPLKFQHTLKRSLTMGKFVAGRVCQKCNNGWMSQLEEQVKPMLVPLIEGTLSLSELTDQQCLILARWACKTAYADNWASPYRHVPLEHLKELKDNTGSIPASVYIFGYQESEDAGHGDWGSYQSYDWVTEFAPFTKMTLQECGEQIQRKAYKISLQLNNFHLLVAYLPLIGWSVQPVWMLHELIWPKDSLLIYRVLEPAFEELPTMI